VSTFIKSATLFVLGIGLSFGLFAVGMMFFNQYYAGVLIGCGLVYFAILYLLEKGLLKLFRIDLKTLMLSTMAAPILAAALGLALVKLISALGGFSAGSFADLAWVIVLMVILVVPAVALLLRGLLAAVQNKKQPILRRPK
jgi:hypothetical protein